MFNRIMTAPRRDISDIHVFIDKKKATAIDTARISFRIMQEGTEDRFFNCSFESC